MDTITTPVVVQSPPETSILHRAQVSLTSRSPASVVHLVQYDTTTPIVAVALTANGQPYTVPSGASVNVRLAKPDGTYVYDPVYGVSADYQTVYIATTVQMTVCSGKLAPVVEVVINGGVAATGFFILDIDPNPIPEDAIASTNEYKTIQQIAVQVQQAADLVESQATNLQNVTDNLAAIQGAAANAQAAAQSAAQAAQSAQQALGFRTFFDAISPDSNGSLDPSRPMTTAAAQASWTVNSRGDRIQSVQVNGFTSDGQSGGLQLVAYVFTGAETWQKDGLDPNYPQYIRFSVYNAPSSVPARLVKQPIYSNLYKCFSTASAYTPTYGIGFYGNQYWCSVAVDSTKFPDVTLWENHLADLYDEGTPLVYWFTAQESSQSTGLYIPIQAQGHEYRCQCLPITEALGVGDNVQSNVPSECDQSITIDGSAVAVTASGSAYVATAANAAAGGVAYANELSGLSLLSGQVSIPATSFPSTVTSAETANTWLQSNPQTVYYQSTVYTEQTDIPIELEAHAGGAVYAHPAVDLVAVPYTSADTGQTPGTYVVSSQDGTTVAVSLKAFQDGGDSATVGGQSLEQLQGQFAPTSHASANNTYGLGTASLYGHVQLSDTAGASDSTDGVAATPKCVQDAVALLQQAMAIQPGETLSVTQVCMPGLITTAGTQLWMSIPLPKPVSSAVTGVQITAGNIAVRGDQGYIIGSSSSDVSVTTLDITAAASYSNVRFIISDSGAYSASNNTPIIGYLVNGTLEFS